MKRTATFVRDVEGWKGEVKLYKVEPPVEYYPGPDYSQAKITDHVLVSAVVVGYWGEGPETYIFPANADGRSLDMGELSGSFKGALDHQRAIDGLCNREEDE